MTFAIMMFRTLIKPFVLNGLIPSHYSLLKNVCFPLKQCIYILHFKHQNMQKLNLSYDSSTQKVFGCVTVKELF